MSGKKKYKTEEERKAARREISRRWREKNAEYNAEYQQNNKEKIAKQRAEYRKNNKEKIAEQNAEYRSTKYGRANNLLGGYRREDKKHNRGECTLTAEWIFDNVFSGQSCVYCGESDWMKLGCDRKDSSLPHTPENCVPCCKHCNDKKNTTPYDQFMRLIDKIV